MKYCPFCGLQCEDGARFCGNCGYQFGGETEAPRPKQKKTVLIGILVALGIVAAAVAAILLLTGRDGARKEPTTVTSEPQETLPSETIPEETTEPQETGAPKISVPEFEMQEETIEFRLSDGTLYYSNTIQYPYFTGASEAEAKLNRRYSDTIKSCKSNDTDFDEAYRTAQEWGDPSQYLPFYDDITAEVVCNERGVLSVKEVYAMWSGGAHVYYYETGLNYDIRTGAELTLSDILQGEEDQVNSVLRFYFAEALWEPSDNEISSLREYTAFTLSGNGLCFYYNVGDAAPRVEVVIPYTSEDTYAISAQELLERLREPKEETTLEGYADAVEQAMEEMYNVYSFAKGDGVLYDLDGDGIQELIVVYFAKVTYNDMPDIPAAVYSVYTMSGGAVAPVVEKELLFIDAGGPTGSVSVVEKGGKVFLAVNEENGGADETGLLRGGNWYLYSLQGAELTLEETIGYRFHTNWENNEDKIIYEDSSATINGKTEPYTALEDWLAGLSELAVAKAWPETDGLQALLNQLS